ncbi:DUF89 domain containing protein [Trichuris trichiura]|uniref:Sugar phosphate phosphatase n=1 Tax=Trichuris trichiura TaxID=36087 RepID=A0A077ZE66_TRITR|nr:DUF89 domain containing protein [Trichuris trichiura]
MHRARDVGLLIETPTGAPLCAKFRSSFAYVTVKDRLPVILTKVIDTVHRHRHSLISKFGEEASEDVKRVISHLSELRYRLSTDKPLTLINSTLPDCQIWNKCLEEYKQEARLIFLVGAEATWFTCPWLLCESYFYRKINEAIETRLAPLSSERRCVLCSVYMKSWDPFAYQKEQSFISALPTIAILATLATRMTEHLSKISNINEARQDLWEVFQICLWGNRCDLSLSDGEQVKSDHFSDLQSLAKLRPFILVNHFDELFKLLAKIRDKTASTATTCLDIVLDNGGIELFGDIFLADVFLELKLVGRIRFHAKALPYYVSDTMAVDFSWIIEMLRSSSNPAMSTLGNKWAHYLEKALFELKTHLFWTSPYPYHRMNSVAAELYQELATSDLIIFKGDLNYRKLLADINVESTLPFSDALQGFSPSSLLALRTIKADLIAGLAAGQRELVEYFNLIISRAKTNPKWMLTGEYAVIQFHEKANF